MIVGHVSRCIYSPRVGKNIGFANVPTAILSVGDNNQNRCARPKFKRESVQIPLDSSRAHQPSSVLALLLTSSTVRKLQIC
ncbi:MAG: glycine cleavage T C-terminal barrel domain-containing protein [Porticoccaceae bacterium]